MKPKFVVFHGETRATAPVGMFLATLASTLAQKGYTLRTPNTSGVPSGARFGAQFEQSPSEIYGPGDAGSFYGTVMLEAPDIGDYEFAAQLLPDWKTYGSDQRRAWAAAAVPLRGRTRNVSPGDRVADLVVVYGTSYETRLMVYLARQLQIDVRDLKNEGDMEWAWKMVKPTLLRGPTPPPMRDSIWTMG